MPSAIEVRALSKSFGQARVLTGIDLEVEQGSVFALLGPNGAGKTTLISILSTLVAPDAGVALVNGIDVAADPAAVRRVIGLTGQAAAVDEVLTGEENLRMMGRLFGLGRAQARLRAAELLERFELTTAARRRVKTYSGGMRRRLDLAISLTVAPPVLFLDEPTTGLDPRSRVELWSVIRSLRAEGTTVFLTTQYLEEADQLADRIAVLGGGRVVADGTVAELKGRVGGDVVELRDAEGMLLREIPTDGTVMGLQSALDSLGVTETTDAAVSIRKPSLDDVFFSLTSDAAPELLAQKG